jgi:hypothetical protein
MTKRQKKYPTPGDVMVISGIVVLMGLAVREQLHLPKDQRTWHGTLFGILYDFRCPTFERLHETFWNKKTARVLVPHAFGMGWTINFYPLINPPPAEQRPEPPITRISQQG